MYFGASRIQATPSLSGRAISRILQRGILDVRWANPVPRMRTARTIVRADMRAFDVKTFYRCAFCNPLGWARFRSEADMSSREPVITVG